MTIEQLRQAREARGLSLKQLGDRTRIGQAILQRIEAGDFAALPPGVYARGYLRAYAKAVGLDPAEVVAEFESRLPACKTTITSIRRSIDGASERMRIGERLRFDSILAWRSETAVDPGDAHRLPGARAGWRLYLAAIVDGLLLAVAALLLLAISAFACGVTIAELLRLAALSMVVLFGVIVTGYFGLLGGVAGRTLGAHVAGIQLVRAAQGPLDLAGIIRRGWYCLIKELSILVGFTLHEEMAAAPLASRTPVATHTPHLHVIASRATGS
jgi:transcriptional regulator with XRE-family HTH domain